MSCRQLYSPTMLASALIKQAAPLCRYAGSSANEIPLRFDRKGRRKKTKSAWVNKEKWDDEVTIKNELDGLDRQLNEHINYKQQLCLNIWTWKFIQHYNIHLESRPERIYNKNVKRSSLHPNITDNWWGTIPQLALFRLVAGKCIGMLALYMNI